MATTGFAEHGDDWLRDELAKHSVKQLHGVAAAAGVQRNTAGAPAFQSGVAGSSVAVRCPEEGIVRDREVCVCVCACASRRAFGQVDDLFTADGLRCLAADLGKTHHHGFGRAWTLFAASGGRCGCSVRGCGQRDLDSADRRGVVSPAGSEHNRRYQVPGLEIPSRSSRRWST